MRTNPLEAIRIWRIKRILIKRAGLKAAIDAYGGKGSPYPWARQLGECEERLRQLGYTEGK